MNRSASNASRATLYNAATSPTVAAFTLSLDRGLGQEEDTIIGIGERETAMFRVRLRDGPLYLAGVLAVVIVIMVFSTAHGETSTSSFSHEQAPLAAPARCPTAEELLLTFIRRYLRVP